MLFLFFAIVTADQLLQVHILWRHGARLPYFCNWRCNETGTSSELTPAGMRQQYVLGQWLREKYVESGFLSETFNENEIYIESSDTNRTLMSAYSNLQGMYPLGPTVPNVADDLLLPPVSGAKTPDDIQNFALPNQIQLIPIHTKQTYLDYTIYMYCESLWDEGEKNKKTDVFYDINNRSQELITTFNNALKQNISTIIDLYEWRDTFISYQYNGLQDDLPKELTQDLMDELNKIAGLGFLLAYTQNYYQAQLTTSAFYSTILDRIDSNLNKSSTIKYYAYSGHDSSIYASLYTLNLTSVECYNKSYFGGETDSNCIVTYPDYASNIIYELYNSSIIGLYVKILYNGTYVNVCDKDTYFCKYSRFKQLMKSVNKDYENECQNSNDNDIILINEETPWWALIFFTLLIAILICTIAMIIMIYQRKKKYGDIDSI